MAIPVEKQLYDSAETYYQGATILMKPSSSSPAPAMLVSPAVTCAALSMKLYLKCLLAIEGKDKEDNIYRFADLYRNLGDGTRKVILEKFDEFSNTQLSSEELAKHLEALDNAFVKWRYIHEDEAKSVNLTDLEDMILAAKAAVKTARPGWD